MAGNRSDRWELAGVVGGLIAAPAVLLTALRTVPALDVLFRSAVFHLAVVSAIAACALQVAVFAAVAARRSRQPSMVLLALGCLFVGLFLLGHGLTTPGIRVPVSTADVPAGTLSLAAAGGSVQWVGRFPVLAIVFFAGALGLAALPQRGAVSRWIGKHPGLALVIPAGLTAAVCGLIVARPTALMGTRAIPGEAGLRHILEYSAIVVLLLTGFAHLRRWRLGRDHVQFALMAACWLSAQAVIALEFGELWRVSWWDYHAYLLAGFGAAVFAVYVNYRRTRTIEGVLGTVFSSDPLHHIEQSHPDALRALVGAVEAKDGYTAGHSTRVAEWSVRIGVRMGLSPETLRRLAQGALLHDIGKIGVPDNILNKPGALTPDEREWIEQHPVIGWEIVRRAKSLNYALDVIRYHHERIDGTGYPDKLEQVSIPLAARIAAVADVWDALTSNRAYRVAWPPDQALAHIVAGRGTHFDGLCVDAFTALLASQGVAADAAGDVQVAVEAASDCHRHLAPRKT